MHRMGPSGAKLVEFDAFVRNFASQRDRIGEVEGLALKTVASTDVARIAENVWRIIPDLKVSATETQIVAGSKALHHVLPELVPPIDREYTLQFFYNQKMLQTGERQTFAEIFPQFRRILQSCKDEIQRRLGSGHEHQLDQDHRQRARWLCPRGN
jgi:hypothetical protein